MKRISYAMLDELSEVAARSPRRRAHLNLHPDLDDPIQRLAIAMEPNSYVRPHRHRHTWELLSVLRGRAIGLHFDDSGIVLARAILGAESLAIETPLATWHTMLALDPGTVLLEVKHGPYAPIAEEDFASWAPKGDAGSAGSFLEWIVTANIGERYAGA